jgi:hypothetical protein
MRVVRSSRHYTLLCQVSLTTALKEKSPTKEGNKGLKLNGKVRPIKQTIGYSGGHPFTMNPG